MAIARQLSSRQLDSILADRRVAFLPNQEPCCDFSVSPSSSRSAAQACYIDRGVHRRGKSPIRPRGAPIYMPKFGIHHGLDRRFPVYFTSIASSATRTIILAPRKVPAYQNDQLFLRPFHCARRPTTFATPRVGDIVNLYVRHRHRPGCFGEYAELAALKSLSIHRCQMQCYARLASAPVGFPMVEKLGLYTDVESQLGIVQPLFASIASKIFSQYISRHYHFSRFLYRHDLADLSKHRHIAEEPSPSFRLFQSTFSRHQCSDLAHGVRR